MVSRAPPPDAVRTAEVIGSLCLATDLAMGFPLEHGLRSTLLGVSVAARLGLDEEELRRTFYGSLLFYAGCTADAEVAARMFPPGALLEHFTPAMFGSPGEIAGGVVRALGSPDLPAPLRFAQGMARLPGASRGHRRHQAAMCEVALMLADRLGAPADVCALFPVLTARWDGRAPGASGDAIPLPIRIAQVARDFCFQRVLGGVEHATTVIRRRAGSAFDPAVVDVLEAVARDPLPDASGSVWSATMAAEPSPPLMLEGEEVDRALAAVGDFADLVCPHLVGHSAGVSALAGRAATVAALPSPAVVSVRRAGSVHDIGRVAVEAAAWNRPGPLTADEWERARLHPHHTERVLSRSGFLMPLGALAGTHHECLDGSGYHRGSFAPALEPPARLLAAADAFRTLVETRPHRPAHPPEEATRALGERVRAGRLDGDAVAAVLEAAGQEVPPLPRPAGLTDRETQVVVLLAKGLQTKQVAHRLGISAKTADRHLQNAYAKTGVSTRAALALFAMQHGLLTWGELPMSGARGRP